MDWVFFIVEANQPGVYETVFCLFVFAVVHCLCLLPLPKIALESERLWRVLNVKKVQP